MAPGHLDIVGRGVDPGHAGAEFGQGFGQYAAAAADVGEGQPRQRLRGMAVAMQITDGEIADIIDADRVDRVKNPHLAACVPPEIAQTVEAVDIGRIDAGGGGTGSFVGTLSPRCAAVFAIAEGL